MGRALTPSSNTQAATLKKEKYEKLLDEHYSRAKSTAFGGWYDSEMRDWLVQHGFLKSDIEAKRDEVGCSGGVALMFSSLVSCRTSTRTLPRHLTLPGLMLVSAPSSGATVLTTPSSLPAPRSCTRLEVSYMRYAALTCSSLRPDRQQGRADSRRDS